MYYTSLKPMKKIILFVYAIMTMPLICADRSPSERCLDYCAIASNRTFARCLVALRGYANCGCTLLPASCYAIHIQACQTANHEQPYPDDCPSYTSACLSYSFMCINPCSLLLLAGYPVGGTAAAAGRTLEACAGRSCTYPCWQKLRNRCDDLCYSEEGDIVPYPQKSSNKFHAANSEWI